MMLSQLTIDCVISLLLIITAPNERDQYENPVFHGCTINRPYSVHIQAHQIIIYRRTETVWIPLPPKKGNYQLTYRFGSDTAEIEHWGKVQVRYGPLGYY